MAFEAQGEVRGTNLGSVLVTGGAGFIGCALSQKLAADADRWIVLDNLHSQVHEKRERPSALHPNAELIVGDVTDAHTWDDLLGRVQPDVIIHLAAETGTAQSLHESTRHASVNVVGTTTMLDALSRTGYIPKRFVLSSSRAVYGEGEWTRDGNASFFPGQRSHAQFENHEWDFKGATPLASNSEKTWPAPTSVYGATKLAQEHVLSAWSSSHDVALSILRLQNVYGPGQSLINSYTGIVSLFSRIAREGGSIPIYEDGLITRDFVYIDDVASAFSAVLHADVSAVAGRFDVGSGTPTTILELATVIAEFYDAPTPHLTAAYRDGDVRFAACDIDGLRTATGWTPEWKVRDGVAALQDWIAGQD